MSSHIMQTFGTCMLTETEKNDVKHTEEKKMNI